MDDVAYIMQWEKGHQAKSAIQQEIFVELNTEEQLLYDHLKSNTEMSFDRLHHLSRLSLSKVAKALLSLELKGMILSQPGKKYRLTP